MKKIQILMATYNGEKFVRQQLESVVGQTNHEWELLIRDDCSMDKTPYIIRSFADEYPDTIKIIDNHGMRLGAVNNFGELLKHSDTDYVMFADQDDVWLADKIEKTLGIMRQLEQLGQNNRPLLVHTDLCVVDEDLGVISSSMWRLQKINPRYKTLNRLIVQNNITGCTMMINRRLAELVKSFPEGVLMHDWWIALVAACFGEIAYTCDATVLYRQHGSNTIGVKKFNPAFVFDRIRKWEEIRMSIVRCRVQSGIFYSHFSECLNSNQGILLKDFSMLGEKSLFKRRLFLFKHSIFKYGFTRNIGLVIYS